MQKKEKVKKILFLGAGKNQCNAIKEAKKLGYYTIGVDNAKKPGALRYLDEHIRASTWAYNKHDGKIDIAISFSPGPPGFNAQKIKNTIGKYAYNTIVNNLKWHKLFEKNNIKIPRYFENYYTKSTWNWTCGGMEVWKNVGIDYVQEEIEGERLYDLIVVKDGKILNSWGFFRAYDKWGALGECEHKQIELLIKILKFKTGCLMVETINGYIIDIGIELEPDIVEQVLSYKEVFELYGK